MVDQNACAPTVLVVDVPWLFRDKLPHGGSETHYECMSVEELYRFPLPDEILNSKACVMFFWRLSSMPGEALSVIRSWGFVVKSELVWLKRTKTGKRWFGMGRYVRMEHEVCHIATFGRAFPEVANVRSTFEGEVRGHSRKPEEFYRLVEQLYPSSPKYELFARIQRPGWVQFGHQLGEIA